MWTGQSKKTEEVRHMLGTIRKAVLAGIGAGVLAKEKVEELIKKGEAAGRPELVKDLLARAEEERKRLEEKADEAIRKAMEKLQVPTKADLEALSGKLDRLAERLDRLEKAK